MAHEASISAILKSSAHQETQNAHQETDQTLNRMKSSSGYDDEAWNMFEENEVKKLDSKSHDAHVKAVHKIVVKGKSLPPEQQQGFMESAKIALSHFGDLMSYLFKKLSNLVVDAFHAIKGIVGDAIHLIGELLNSLINAIDSAIHTITDWANDAAHAIEDWNPFRPAYFHI